MLFPILIALGGLIRVVFQPAPKAKTEADEKTQQTDKDKDKDNILVPAKQAKKRPKTCL